MAQGSLLSLREASERCHVSTSRLRRLAARGVLRASKVGAYWVVTKEALDEFMELERPRGVRVSARGAARGKGKGRAR
jgi:excisionase family DNA binding protein